MADLTKLQHMVDPEVLADMISAELPAALKFAPLAQIDGTLEGQPGSTVTVPKFKYIGEAEDLAEGATLDLSLLETSTEQFTIKKIAKGVQLTDEALLSGYGDPLGEAARQLAMSLADKIDNDVIENARAADLEFEGDVLDIDFISDALDLFSDEDDETKVILLNPKDASKLRRAAAGEWERASDLGDNILSTGVYGAVLGAQVIRSNKIEEGEGFIVKPGAFRIYTKRGALVETDRDIRNFTNLITASQHYGAHLYDESKAIKLKIGGASTRKAPATK